MGKEHAMRASSQGAESLGQDVESMDLHVGAGGVSPDVPNGQGSSPMLARRPSGWLTAGALLLLTIVGAVGVYWLDTSGLWPQASTSQGNQRSVDTPASTHASQSGSARAPQSDSAHAVQSGEQQMSGRYPIGPNGKLLRPADAPIPVRPTRPPNMVSDGKEGMEVFTHYIVDVLQYTWASGKTSKLEAISSPECKWCRAVIEASKKLRNNGGWIEEGNMSIVGMSEAHVHPELADHWYTHVVIHQTAASGYDGTTLQEAAARDIKLGFVGTFKKGKWILVGGGAVK